MVGVPRSRGCTACQKQKKKCIVLSKPPCSRCSRLKISCIGYGERRLKFQDESQNFISRGNKNTAPRPSRSLSDSPESTRTSQKEHHVESPTIPATVPMNVLNALIASFTRSIDGRNTDTGLHLAWNFGAFLQDVPPYLGFNESLDAAADALAAAYDHFRRRSAGYIPASAVCLQKYSQAVKSLRTSLSTIEEACEPSTLCAIQIVMTVETLIGISHASPLQHAGGAARILKCRGTRPPKDKMERNILMTLRGPVVIQAFFLDESFYTNTEWASLLSGSSVGAKEEEEEGFFSGLAATARLFQRTRKALSQDIVSLEDTERLLSCATTLHQTMMKKLSNLSDLLDRARDTWAIDLHSAKTKFAHGLCTRDFGFALLTQIIVNCMLAALRGEWQETAKEEVSKLCQGICELGESDATHHRPLGSGWIPVALCVAYVGTSSVENKTRVVRLLEDYTQDFPRENSEVKVVDMERFAAYLSCRDLARDVKL